MRPDGGIVPAVFIGKRNCRDPVEKRLKAGAAGARVGNVETCVEAFVDPGDDKVRLYRQDAQGDFHAVRRRPVERPGFDTLHGKVLPCPDLHLLLQRQPLGHGAALA